MDILLQENGFALLQENGSYILLAQDISNMYYGKDY